MVRVRVRVRVNVGVRVRVRVNVGVRVRVRVPNQQASSQLRRQPRLNGLFRPYGALISWLGSG